MVPTDRQLVDSLIATIHSMSKLIEVILEHDIEAASLDQVVNIARIKALDKARRDFQLRALIIEYALHLPK